MNSFRLKVIASDKEFFNGQALSVTIPVKDGQKQILAHHEDMIFSTEIGQLKFKKEDGETEEAVVGYGFTQVVNNRVTVLVDSAEHPDEIDFARAKEAEERAKEQMRQHRSIREYNHSRASLARAMSRLKYQGRDR